MKLWDFFQLGDEPDPEVLKHEITQIERAAKGLFGQRRRLFICDCVERVLTIYTKPFPNDDRPRTAIMDSRRFVFGIVTPSGLAKVHEAAVAAYDEAVERAPEKFDGNWPPVLIARACVMASIPDVDALEPAEVCHQIVNAVNATSPHALKESRWQYKRLQWYLEQSPLIVPPRSSK